MFLSYNVNWNVCIRSLTVNICRSRSRRSGSKRFKSFHWVPQLVPVLHTASRTKKNYKSTLCTSTEQMVWEGYSGSLPWVPAAIIFFLILVLIARVSGASSNRQHFENGPLEPGVTCVKWLRLQYIILYIILLVL